MSDHARLHPVHGENVVLNHSRTLATWRAIVSNSVVFSDDFLRPGDEICVKAEGSGRVEVGITSQPPDSLRGNIPRTASAVPGFQTMNEIRFHKRSCCLTVALNAEGNKLTSTCKPVAFQKNVERSTRLWIVLYVMFGRVNLKLIRNGGSAMPFSAAHGHNINMTSDRTNGYTINPNPGALCSLDTPLTIGDTVVLRCSPLIDNNKVVSNYSIKLMASAEDPIARTNKHMEEVQLKDPVVLETLAKRECEGDIKITLQSERIVEYLNAQNKSSFELLPFEGATGTWLCFELYRVTMELVNIITPRGQQNQADCRAELDKPKDGSPTCKVRSSQYLSVLCGANIKQPVIEQDSPSMYRACTEESLDESYGNDYYLQVSARRGSLMSSLSCPAGLDKVPDQKEDQHVLEKLSNIENKVDTLERHLASLPDDFQCGALDLTQGADDMVNVRENIRRNFVELLYCLQTESMCDHLYQHGVLSSMEWERVHQTFKVDRQSSNRVLLGILSKRNVSRTVLTKVLEDVGDQYLVKLFFK